VDDFDRIRDIIDKSINGYLNFIMSYSDDAEEITNLNKDYNIGTDKKFNIFRSISENYQWENLHSDILRLIFDPRTETICNGCARNLRAFIDFIEKERGIKIGLDLYTVEIDREKPFRIDILISDKEKNCVFIENKINGAPDRKDQIGSYYRKLNKRNYKVNAIVYLTLSPKKNLDWDYSIKNKAIQKEIKDRKILLELPVVNKKGESNFIDGVLNECINQAKNDVSKVYLSQYRDLLKKLGGEFMSDEIRVQLLQKIYADKDGPKSFKVIGDLWKNKDKFICYAFREYFQHVLGFSVSDDKKPDTYVFKTIKKGINIGFDIQLSFGFVHAPNEEGIQFPNFELLEESLEDKSLEKYFTKEKVDDNGWWVYKQVDPEKITCLNDLKTMEKELERLIKEKTSD